LYDSTSISSQLSGTFGANVVSLAPVVKDFELSICFQPGWTLLTILIGCVGTAGSTG
jgi:predicted lysophospholipase L1 biosynthesis ABC-type transport system permease subunit